MDPIALAAGTTLVGAMANDAWQGARSAMTALWRRVRPEQADAIDAELAETRAQILSARAAGELEIEQVLAADWQLRLQALVRTNPTVADELQNLLDTRLTPLLATDERSAVGSVGMKAKASGSGRVYQAGRDQHITER
ncbi:hypothetical protein AB0D86_47615 [Streptomyces sp. NPDC048324]|uniref:hypothetical protein n=1 Tax=Streptomyces sp. NPDC048324 TaxID=3157205 RepID=UPI00343D5473